MFKIFNYAFVKKNKKKFEPNYIYYLFQEI